ncbi:hypothetical protein MNBD_GAMMA15-2227 [hydrothermal vent metagenome]|uniref:Negative regulator of flagellin synthesis n=1 Tax=hydrothermal vent metagenome TaxID=652676 RepID=A0A3B0Y9X3_9ZZZZ
MEIDSNRVATLVSAGSSQGSAVENQDRSKSAGKPADTSTTRSTADSVNLTGEARTLQALEAQIASLPVVDSQRVETVRAAVESNTFPINPERIAEKMMSLEQALTDMR